LHVALRPHTAESELLELSVLDETQTKVGNIVFATIQDRSDRQILSVRDQNTFDLEIRRKRFMTLLQLFLIHRYKIVAVHYVSPNDANLRQSESMKEMGIFEDVHTEIGHIIVASVNSENIKETVNSDGVKLKQLIAKA
jgi:isocitrate lyase